MGNDSAHPRRDSRGEFQQLQNEREELLEAAVEQPVEERPLTLQVVDDPADRERIGTWIGLRDGRLDEPRPQPVAQWRRPTERGSGKGRGRRDPKPRIIFRLRAETRTRF